MASFPTTVVSPIILFIFLVLSAQSHLPISISDSEIELNHHNHRSHSPNSTDIHDLLPLYGFPKGLLPNNVKSFSLSDDDTFEIELESSCYVKFDFLVYYKQKIKGKLSYGSVSDVSGIQAKKLFLWISVTGMKADKSSGTIEFYAGILCESLPAKQFQEIPSCRKNACLGVSVEAI